MQPRTYSDFADSDVHLHQFAKMGLFQDERDLAFSLSSDGAQLDMKKELNVWIFVLILLNPPGES